MNTEVAQVIKWCYNLVYSVFMAKFQRDVVVKKMQKHIKSNLQSQSKQIQISNIVEWIREDLKKKPVLLKKIFMKEPGAVVQREKG